MTETVVKFPKIYKPLDDDWRYKVLYGGRAAARSWTIARKLLLRGTQRPEFILCTRELQKSIKQSVHKLLKKQIDLLNLSHFYTVQEQSIKGINGTEIMFLGVKANPEEIKSTEGITICWIEEGHSLTESSWDIIDPTIREEGSEIWISFNTRFKFDYLYKKFVVDTPPENALVLHTSYADNPYFPQVLRDQMELMKHEDYEKYLHIWEGGLKSLAEGAIFGPQITKVKKDGRQLYIPVQDGAEVYTFSDIGKSDPSAFWFMQKIGKEWQFIDYYDNRLVDVDHYVKVIKALGYNYGGHYMPHDADHDRLGMTRNVREQFEDSGIQPVEIVNRARHKEGDAIEPARRIFAECWFHKHTDTRTDELSEGYLPFVEKEKNTRSKRCERGWDALSNYRYKYKDDADTYNRVPHHDFSSNGADAFMQFAQSSDEIGQYEYHQPNVHRSVVGTR